MTTKSKAGVALPAPQWELALRLLRLGLVGIALLCSMIAIRIPNEEVNENWNDCNCGDRWNVELFLWFWIWIVLAFCIRRLFIICKVWRRCLVTWTFSIVASLTILVLDYAKSRCLVEIISLKGWVLMLMLHLALVCTFVHR